MTTQQSSLPKFLDARAALLVLILRTSPSVNYSLRALCLPFDRFATAFSRAISLTVSELFMTIFVPIAATTIDVNFARRIMFLFSINLCTVNSCKNFLRLPRPRTATGEALSQEEPGFGFPSLHSAAGLALPAFIASSSSPLGASLSVGIAGRLTAAWPLLIGFARLHLGVHSLPDVLGGWLVGFVLSRYFERAVASGPPCTSPARATVAAAPSHALPHPHLTRCGVCSFCLLFLPPSHPESLLTGWLDAVLRSNLLPPLVVPCALALALLHPRANSSPKNTELTRLKKQESGSARASNAKSVTSSADSGSDRSSSGGTGGGANCVVSGDGGESVPATKTADGSVTESAIVLGCSAGTAIAVWRSWNMPERFVIPPLAMFVGLGGPQGVAARFIAAAIAVSLTKAVLKPAARKLVDSVTVALGPRTVAMAPEDGPARDAVARVLCYTPLAYIVMDIVPQLTAAA